MESKKTEIAATKRSANLIASFTDGFVDGWYFALKESYKIELDIKLTERRKNRLAYYEWTQGPYYCFSEGQIIYDSKEAYTRWEDALKEINLACQIIMAKPNIPIKIENDLTGKPEYRVLDGFVCFLLSKPDDGRTKLVPYVGYKLSQNKFVNFLKFGEL
jgi:hypothetical protein